MALKIYTKTGDEGKTGLIGGTRVPKNNIRIESYGTIDELNSFIGLLADYLPDQHGNTICLADYRSRWVLLWWYPKAETPGCTVEGQVLGTPAGSLVRGRHIANSAAWQLVVVASATNGSSRRSGLEPHLRRRPRLERRP